MSLADFMLPEVVSTHIDLRGLANEVAPSPLFCGYDTELEQALVDGRVVPARTPFEAMSPGGYKGHRNTNFLESLPALPTAVILWDMEDARAHAAEVHFRQPLNVFQYNRRRGNRHAVLWRLRAYFEPSRNIGHPGVIVDDNLSFSDKKRTVFWRGSMAGSRWLDPHHRVGPQSLRSEDEFVAAARHFSRLRAVLDARGSEVLDLRLTGPLLEDRPWLAALNVVGEPVGPVEQLNHRYILCPNGNDVASNLYWVMQTNSLAFREECEYEVVPDYFLKPWVHYIPIAKGLSDIEDKFRYCESNLDLCEKIIENANSAYGLMTDKGVWHEAELEILDRLGAS